MALDGLLKKNMWEEVKLVHKVRKGGEDDMAA